MGRPLIVAVLVLGALAVHGQRPEPDVEQRLRTLEEEVRALRAELALLRQARAPVASATPESAPTPDAQAASPFPPQPPAPPVGQGGLPVAAAEPPVTPPAQGSAGARALNPDIGIIGNFVAAGGPSQGGTESFAPLPGLSLQESEASFQAVVDPYARADFFLAIGEEGIEVEEGFITFPALPGGLLVKAGKMRATFGRLNAFHNHSLPWTDRPLVMFNLLGGATDDPDTGIKDAGVSVSRLVPAGKLFVEATAEVFRGDSGTVFKASRRQDLGAVGHLRTYTDLTEQTNLEIGASHARGHNDAGSEFLTRLYGLDLTLRWRPLRRAIYHSFAARAETIWSQREEAGLTQRAFGGFVSADYRLNRRWSAGLRYDWSDRAREADIRDRGASAVLTFQPSEFTQVRSQYRRTAFGDEGVANELLLQVLFTIGAHGAHPF